jgi:hypothetical protein
MSAKYMFYFSINGNLIMHHWLTIKKKIHDFPIKIGKTIMFSYYGYIINIYV